MKKKNITINDFIIFLGLKILPITILALTIVVISVFFNTIQKENIRHWQIEFTKEINNNELLKFIEILKENFDKKRKMEFENYKTTNDERFNSYNAIDDLNKFAISGLKNMISNNREFYHLSVNSKSSIEENSFLSKQNFTVKLEYNSYKNSEEIKSEMQKIFFDNIEFTKTIILLQNDIDVENQENLISVIDQIFTYTILKVTVSHELIDWIFLIKILILSYIISALIFFFYHLRKNIKLL